MSAISLHFRGKLKDDNLLENAVLAHLARSHFRLVSPPQFSRKEPRHPLLKATPDNEQQNIIRIWRVLMRFTGDTVDYRNGIDNSTQPYFGSIITRLSKKWGLTRDDVKQSTLQSGTHDSMENGLPMTSLPNKPRGGTLRHLRSTLTQRLFKNKNETIFHSLPIEDTLMTHLEYVQFIASCGILKAQLRDEIYCMVCKHLVKNPYKTSSSRCWLLLALIIGCFPPSNEICNAIVQFIEESPPLYSTTLKKLLKRSAITEARFQPPSYREMDCYQQKKPIELQITLMDGTVQTVLADGTSTSQDISLQLNDALGLRQDFGYSIFISMSNKVASLGNGTDHVMDAISQCEQIFREQGGTESSAPWRLFYRKELYSPWEDTAGDMIAISLTFAQITRGVMLGEYVCDSDQDLAVLAARQYFTEYGSEISEEGLEGVLPSYIPADRRQQPESTKMWRRLVTKAHQRLFGSRTGKESTIDEVKLDVVQYAKKTWAMSFSRYYDVFKLEGPAWTDNNVKLAINSTGVYVLSYDKQQLYAMTFPDIITLRGESNRTKDVDIIQADDIVLFVLADGSFIKFETIDAIDIRNLVSEIISGLSVRSTWAVVRENIAESTTESIHVVEGDLIELSQPAGKDIFSRDVCMCVNVRTGETGCVPTRILYIIPVLQKPSDQILKMFSTPRRRGIISSRDYSEYGAFRVTSIMVNGRNKSYVNGATSDEINTPDDPRVDCIVNDNDVRRYAELSSSPTTSLERPDANGNMTGADEFRVAEPEINTTTFPEGHVLSPKTVPAHLSGDSPESSFDDSTLVYPEQLSNIDCISAL